MDSSVPQPGSKDDSKEQIGADSTKALNPSNDLEASTPAEIAAGPPRVPVFEKPKAMGPPPPMLPPKFTKADLPGPIGPPLVRTKPSKEEAKEAIPTPAEKADLSSSKDVKEAVEEGEENGAVKKPMEAPNAKAALEPISSGPPYVKPAWSAAPGYPFKLEVLKEGVVVGNFDVSSKGAYMFGRSDRCDFALEHPTVSRYHAVLQYNNKGEAFIFDLGSTHGTFINKRQVKAKVYAPIQVGGIVRFGLSTRLYVLQGPSELMPEEGLSKKERLALKVAEAEQQQAIRTLSLQRAKAEAAALEGASWGMQEDAEEEEEEENLEEVTWQTYKGPLTEKQQKTLEKVHKRHEKMANLKKENDAIKAKETGQGGLTQGQQTQMARNEQRMEQLLEELESLEETVNESIQESLGARTGKWNSKKKPVFEDEEDISSEDEFYDRTSKRSQKKKNGEAVQKVETAESLLEKRDVLAKEMEVVSAELKAEEARTTEQEENKAATESIDPLDAFMSSVSSNIVKDKAARLSKELAKLQAEADRIARLLKIADPAGDAARKWESKAAGSSQSQAVENIVENRLRVRASKESARELASQMKEMEKPDPSPEVNNPPSDRSDITVETKEVPFLAAPLLLGAPRPDTPKTEATAGPMLIETDAETGTAFVGYKDRKRPTTEADGGGESTQVEGKAGGESGSDSRDGASDSALEAVALLLRHKSGLAVQEGQAPQTSKTKARGKKKRKLGPERPRAVNQDAEELEEVWVPPQGKKDLMILMEGRPSTKEGQTGDGRTSLNEKFGY